MLYDIAYAYKRYGQWFTDTYEVKTKLFMDDITKTIIKDEIEKMEMTNITFLEIHNGNLKRWKGHFQQA